MNRTSQIFAAAFVAALAVSPAAAQQQTVGVSGTIVGVDGPLLVVKQRRDGSEVKLRLADNVVVSGAVRKTIADIKPGNFIGVGAVPQADGTQKAVRINIFPAGRNPNEGHRPWEGAPQGTMTNATVDTSVSGVDGQMVTVKYKDGEKRILVTNQTLIITTVPADKSELKPGANVSVAGAVKQPDGTLVAERINVGRDGVTP